MISLVRVIEDLFALIERVKQVFVHLGHIESLPEISNTFLIISNIFKSEEWIITLSLNSNETFLSYLFNIVLIILDVGLNIFIHSLTSNANKINVEIKSKLWLECNTDCLFGLSIDDTLWCIKVEVLVQNFCKSA